MRILEEVVESYLRDLRPERSELMREMEEHAERDSDKRALMVDNLLMSGQVALPEGRRTRTRTRSRRRGA